MARRTDALLLLFFLSTLLFVKYLLFEIDYRRVDRFSRSLFNTIPLFAYNRENQTRTCFLLELKYRRLQVILRTVCDAIENFCPSKTVINSISKALTMPKCDFCSPRVFLTILPNLSCTHTPQFPMEMGIPFLRLLI